MPFLSGIGHCSHNSAFLAWLPENYLIWVDSIPLFPHGLSLSSAYAVQPPRLIITRTIWSERTRSPLIVPLGLHSISPWVPPWVHEWQILLVLYCTFCAIVQLIIFLLEYSHYCIFWSCNCIPGISILKSDNNYIASLFNKHHTYITRAAPISVLV
jgi:hypothetical protein